MNESRKEIPRVTEAAREIADTHIESQKEIINLVQSAWSPLVENFDRTQFSRQEEFLKSTHIY